MRLVKDLGVSVGILVFEMVDQQPCEDTLDFIYPASTDWVRVGGK